MDPPFLGEIRFFAFTFAPQGWALCNGQVLAITTNVALFSLLGTNYGGDGIHNFALPNMQGRVPFGQGNGHVLGESSGFASVTLDMTQLPTHTHVLQAATTATGITPVSPLGVAAFSAYAKAGTVTALGGVASAGSGEPHENMQPYMVGNFCIAMQGSFPSRS